MPSKTLTSLPRHSHHWCLQKHLHHSQGTHITDAFKNTHITLKALTSLMPSKTLTSLPRHSHHWRRQKRSNLKCAHPNTPTSLIPGQCQNFRNKALTSLMPWQPLKSKECTPPKYSQGLKSKVCTLPEALTSLIHWQSLKSKVCTPPNAITLRMSRKQLKFKECTPPNALASRIPWKCSNPRNPHAHTSSQIESKFSWRWLDEWWTVLTYCSELTLFSWI
jgi:hypothetical protein